MVSVTISFSDSHSEAVVTRKNKGMACFMTNGEFCSVYPYHYFPSWAEIIIQQE